MKRAPLTYVARGALARSTLHLIAILIFDLLLFSSQLFIFINKGAFINIYDVLTAPAHSLTHKHLTTNPLNHFIFIIICCHL